MEELQLQVTSMLGVIEWSNFEELKSQLQVETGKYRGIVLKEEDITEAKATVANFRKLSTAINDERKKIKKTYNDPLKTFEDKVKELDEIIGSLVTEINTQLEDFESNRIEEKKNVIAAIFAETTKEIDFSISLPMIYNSKWENKTCKESEVKKDIEERIFTIKQELNIIRSNISDAKQDAETIYLRELNLTSALEHINRYEQNKKAIEEKAKADAEREAQRKIEEEKERIRREEQAKAQEEAERIRAEEKAKYEEQLAQKEIVETTSIFEEVEIERDRHNIPFNYPTYRIDADEMELTLLESYLEEHDIEFERLD